MEKVWRKSAVKLSPVTIYNFGKKDHEKDNLITWFLHLHPVSFYGQDYEKQKKTWN